jgi:Beta-galactosidase trimerisation domain
MKKFILAVTVCWFTLGAGWLRAAQPKVALLNADVNSGHYFSIHYRYCPGNDPDPWGLGAQEYQRYVGGWAVLLDQMGVAYDVIHDSDLTDGSLDSYQILIAPNSPSLSDDESKAISQWVTRGGRLLATFGTGYEGLIDSTTQFVDDAKVQKGGTNGLHQLWGDPTTKELTSAAVELEQFGSQPISTFEQNFCGGTHICGVEPRITQFSGPTAGLSPDSGFPYEQITGYGDNGNLLTQRPLNSQDVYGWLQFRRNVVDTDTSNDVVWKRPMPAIIADEQAKGLAVYYAFAPEFIVGLEYDVAGHCAGDPNYPGEGTDPGLDAGDNPPVYSKNLWAGRSVQLRQLMTATVNYLLTAP